MNTYPSRKFGIRAAIGMAALFVAVAAIAAPVHASGFYGPRNTIPVEPLQPVVQACGGVFAPAWSGPRPRFQKVKDLGPCPVRQVVRWIGPRATIPVYKG